MSFFDWCHFPTSQGGRVEGTRPNDDTTKQTSNQSHLHPDHHQHHLDFPQYAQYCCSAIHCTVLHVASVLTVGGGGAGI